jgi:hypothetical protein
MSKTLMEVFQPPTTPSERLLAALEALALAGHDAGALEARIGLDRGYLLRIVRGQRRPSPVLVLLLEALARHPEDVELLL